MAGLLYVLTHSTDDPDRAATALAASLAAARAEHDVALWLTGEGVRLGVQGVAETLAEPLEESAAEMRDALIAAGVPLYLDRLSFERRGFEPDVVCAGAEVVGAERLAALLAEGRSAVTL
jgi:predicted peroxiredoxin